MSEGPYWFAPKRYGYGAVPITWQGWALTIGFVLACLADALLFVHKPLVFAALLVPFTVTFIVIAARTTRGGWRWRWGEEEGS
jgi:uncharacterized membrane protein YhhN